MKDLPMPEDIIFHDYPNFTPHYSPVTMLKLGVFGGTYFNGTEESAKKGWDNIVNFIPENSGFWKKLNKAFPNPSDYYKAFWTYPSLHSEHNFFKVRAGKDQKYWEDKGWIHPDDPRGWFEWYIKFYYGRRHEDDARQIKRWKDFITRHWGMLNYLTIKNLKSELATSKKDFYGALRASSPTTCQNLLHWSWDYRIKPKK